MGAKWRKGRQRREHASGEEQEAALRRAVLPALSALGRHAGRSEVDGAKAFPRSFASIVAEISAEDAQTEAALSDHELVRSHPGPAGSLDRLAEC
jgi:hypothetical protein